MRIGECADLSFDCLRFVGHGWAIHVPLGKLKTERLVPRGRWSGCELRFPLPPDSGEHRENAAGTSVWKYLKEIKNSAIDSLAGLKRWGPKLMKKGCSENRVACLSMLQTIADAGNVSAF